MKTPFYTYLGAIGLVGFIVYHFVFGWYHPESGSWHWIHEVSSAFLVIAGISYWLQEIIVHALIKFDTYEDN